MTTKRSCERAFSVLMGKSIVCFAHLGRVGVTNKRDAGPVLTDGQAVDDRVDEVDAAVVDRVHAAGNVQYERNVHPCRATCGQKVACSIRGSLRKCNRYNIPVLLRTCFLVILSVKSQVNYRNVYRTNVFVICYYAF